MQRWITAGMRAAAAVLSVLLSAGIFSAAAYAEAALEEDYYAGEQESSSFSILCFCLFILFMGFSRQES